MPNPYSRRDFVADSSKLAVGAMIVPRVMLGGPGYRAPSTKLNSVPGVPGLTSACKPSNVPLGATAANIHDAVDQATVPFLPGFPYLNTPNAGSATY